MPGGHAALGGRAALGGGVLARAGCRCPSAGGRRRRRGTSWPPDASTTVAALGRVDPLLDRGELAVRDADVEPAGCVLAGPDDRGVGDQQVEGAHGPPPRGRGIRVRRGRAGSTRVSGCRSVRTSGWSARSRHGAREPLDVGVVEAARGVVAELGGELLERQRPLRAAAGGEHRPRSSVPSCRVRGSTAGNWCGKICGALVVGHDVDLRPSGRAEPGSVALASV